MKAKIMGHAIAGILISASILIIIGSLGNVTNNVFSSVVSGLGGDEGVGDRRSNPSRAQSVPASAPSNAIPVPVPGMPAGSPPDSPPDGYYDGADGDFFKDYGVNPRVATGDDYQSTFAVDVDTAAYTIMRSYVMRGILPPEESVRVEEYINFFEQGYTPPSQGAFAIYLEGAPSPYGGSEPYYLVRVGLKGYELSSELRPDSVLTFVIDVSGSMAGDERLEMVKSGVEAMINTLRPTDQVAIVVYSDEARVIREHTPASDAATLIRAVRELSSESSTNVEAGLALGYKLAHEAYNPDVVNRVILCSDGVANTGGTSMDALLSQVKRHADENIYLTTVGVGMGDYNDQLLEQLADQGNGFYTYVDTYRETERFFVHQIHSASHIIAKDAKVQVEFNRDVVSRYRLIGYENRAIADEDFRNDKVDAGEIGVGHSVTALYEVSFHENADSQSDALTVYVRYQNPENAEVIEIKQAIAQKDFAPAFEAASPRFRLTAIVAQYAETIRHSYWSEQSNVTLADIATAAGEVAQTLQYDEDVQEFAQLAIQAAKFTGDQQ
ncbi:MAG: von Willebrand factor type A domain-containing protein [Anaerolineae bacterium]|nr:von Willebrand factor type A domain-containing protein [Anaerolineae bacterium]